MTEPQTNWKRLDRITILVSFPTLAEVKVDPASGSVSCPISSPNPYLNHPQHQQQQRPPPRTNPPANIAKVAKYPPRTPRVSPPPHLRN
ncbi:unnamed protein product [Tuber melanosporum]|uniref:(Perigord truffle) hypothetical protein n=1 Tax=Tuber melanosporum (strain Mel28) TaxID=656061 RepID=D5GAS7_TUBMM|nr:uncharacterized protein GSTUM_00005281001 [Tuber melanosporum]CAZ81620.1 unnamed protein product [Tuber melanosporum]